jgi:hypothetical protein
MAHFAKVENGVVTQVIVAGQDVIDSGMFGTGWVQTSYNTRGGQHPEGRPLRKNYAGVGYTYDRNRDAFIPPRPSPAWTLDETTCLWVAPENNTLQISSSSGDSVSATATDMIIDLSSNGADSLPGGV